MFGLKVWSVNKNYINPLKKLYDEGLFDYIELYAIPETYSDTIPNWKDIKIPFVIHAPHFMQGLNFSDKSKEEYNFKLANEAFMFADSLKSDSVIFHPGIKGDYRETARQVKKLNDKRLIIENKPYRIAKAVMGLKSEDICVGYSKEQLEYILNETGAGFCLDLGHAISAANGVGEEKYTFIDKLLALNPKMFHLSDGDIDSHIDHHYHFGKGSYDIKRLISTIPAEKRLTIETEKDSQDNLDDFKTDVLYLKNIIEK